MRFVVLDEQAQFRKALIRLLGSQREIALLEAGEEITQQIEPAQVVDPHLVLVELEVPTAVERRLRRHAASELPGWVRGSARPTTVVRAGYDRPSTEAGLTYREIEVLNLVTSGLSNKEIATRLVLSQHTVKNHIRHILAKLRVRRRRQAAELASAHSWFSQPETTP